MLLFRCISKQSGQPSWVTHPSEKTVGQFCITVRVGALQPTWLQVTSDLQPVRMNLEQVSSLTHPCLLLSYKLGSPANKIQMSYCVWITYNSTCPRAPPYWVWVFLVRKTKELSIIDSYPTNRPGTPSALLYVMDVKAHSLDMLPCSGFVCEPC